MRRWSIKLGTVAGIGIYAHATFPLLLAWAGYIQYRARSEWVDVWFGWLFILLLFAIITLHELGHALTARRFGIGTYDITLLPIGGLARLERMPEKPEQELLIAIAGPAVNLCLAILFFAILGGGVQIADLFGATLMGTDLLSALMWINIVLLIFNLLPAFPMDGGRVVRALLALRLKYVTATSIAAVIGQTMAVGFGFLGVSYFFQDPIVPFANPLMLLIAVFVWVGAAQEARHVRIRSEFEKVRVSDVMMREFRTVSPEAPLATAVEHLLSGWEHDFPVVESGHVHGVLTRSDLLKGVSEHGQQVRVADVMHHQFQTISPEESADKAADRLRASDVRTILVLANGFLKGILPSERLGEYLRLRGTAEA